MRHLLAVVALLALLTGCASTAADETGGSLAERQQSNGAVIPGYQVSIPRLGVSSTLQSLGLNADKTIQVPSLADPMQAGVYANGPMPGQVGPAVVLAHVNAGGKPGFGAGFHALRAGDVIDFSTPTGPVVYRVTEVQTVPKDRYPTARVFSDTPTPTLRLITCGPGPLDASGHNFVAQTIVFAVKA